MFTSGLWIGLYKILRFTSRLLFKVVHESTIAPFPSPTCIAHPGSRAIRLHDYWTVHGPRPPYFQPPVCMPYTIQYWYNNIV